MNKGFSLIEMVVVVAMMGIVYAIAEPKFNSILAKARRVEAVKLLSHIDVLMKTHRQETGVYTDGGVSKSNKFSKNKCNSSLPNSIGLYVNDCKDLRYQYWIEDATAFGFVAFARNNLKQLGDKANIYQGCKLKSITPDAILYGADNGNGAGTASSKQKGKMPDDLLGVSDRQRVTVLIDKIAEC